MALNWKVVVLSRLPSPLFCRFSSSFKSSDICITPCTKKKSKPKGGLGFGKYFTDHMLTVSWEADRGWGKPCISEFGPLSLLPSIKAIHYAVSAFEGFKVIKGKDGTSRLFRPQAHAERFLSSAERLCLPAFDPKELVECTKTLVRLDESWVPSESGESLYVRPSIFASDPRLGVDLSSSAILNIILSPAGSYFSDSSKGIALYANPSYVRAWKGGSGAYKMAANYAPTIYVQKLMRMHGCQTALWLYGPDEFLTEAGTMNIFIFWTNKRGEKELITPPLNGLILPGVTRMSILEMTRSWNEFAVREGELTMKEVLEANQENRLHCFFGTGTACVVSPVAELFYKGDIFHFPNDTEDSKLVYRIHKEFTDLQSFARGPNSWMVSLDAA